MMKIAIIGAGISGLTVAHLLKDRYRVKVFEKEDRPGGLIKCNRIDGSLFHTCGGHVFNSKRKDVLEWFWSFFLQDNEFCKADRNSCVFLDKNGDSLDYVEIPYPIENHMYLFEKRVQDDFYIDLEEVDQVKGTAAKLTDYNNFGDFLRWRFGRTLYNMYFKPYNEKVWRRDLTSVPMSWMEDKLPMPTTQEMRDNNKNHIEEKAFVHSTFWYEKVNGSQYIADKLSHGLDIQYKMDISEILLDSNTNKWYVGGEEYDKVVFCGNIKDISNIIYGVDLLSYKDEVKSLQYHGTTAVFCEIDQNPYSWIYLPSHNYQSHRIICSGNFSSSNNDKSIKSGRITATIEFTDEISEEEILDNLTKIPLNPRYIDHKFNKYTYPIQNANTRQMIKKLKAILASYNFYFTGRFADWEYYNMDVAMGAAMDMIKTYKL